MYVQHTPEIKAQAIKLRNVKMSVAAISKNYAFQKAHSDVGSYATSHQKK